MDISQFLHPETIEILRNGGYLLMFGLMVAEGPFVTMAAAFLASFGIFNIFVVAILGWMGDTAGDVVLFYLGRFGSQLLQKRQKKQKMSEEKKENFLCTLDNLMEKHFVLALLLIKFTPYAPMIAYPYLGTRQISGTKFIIITSLLSIPVPFTVAIIGFHIEKVQYIFANIPQYYHIPVIICLILIIAIIIFGMIKLFPKIQNYIHNKAKNSIKTPH